MLKQNNTCTDSETTTTSRTTTQLGIWLRFCTTRNQSQMPSSGFVRQFGPPFLRTFGVQCIRRARASIILFGAQPRARGARAAAAAAASPATWRRSPCGRAPVWAGGTLVARPTAGKGWISHREGRAGTCSQCAPPAEVHAALLQVDAPHHAPRAGGARARLFYRVKLREHSQKC
eukprot:gene10179-biopygen10803